MISNMHPTRAHKHALLGLMAMGLFISGHANAQVDDATPSLSVEERIAQLERDLNTLKAQQALDAELTQAANDKTPVIVIDKKGFKVTSVDKKYELAINGTFQSDYRIYGKDGRGSGTDGFIARRLRPNFVFKAGDATFRLQADLGGSAPAIFDAYADYRFSDELTLRFGKQKSPVGFERNQSAADLVTIERGHATNLASTRDFGVQVFGNLIPNVLEYNLGVFNGAPDLGRGEGEVINLDKGKDVAGRLFVTPFANSETVFLQGFSFGLAASSGKAKGNATTSNLPAYLTQGQVAFFNYTTGAFANGTHSRFNPQLSFYYGPFGLLSEAIESKQVVRLGTTNTKLKHRAVSVTASYVLTGEDVGYKGGVRPANDFNLSNGTWGAFEVSARYGYTDLDNKTFVAGLSNLNSSASKATTTGLGAAWYTSENVKLLFNYDKTRFIRGALITVANPQGHRAEEVFGSARLQVRF